MRARVRRCTHVHMYTCTCMYVYVYESETLYTYMYPPKNGVIALWPNTRVVKCKYYVSHNPNGFNNKTHTYFYIFKFTRRIELTKNFVPSNLE